MDTSFVHENVRLAGTVADATGHHPPDGGIQPADLTEGGRLCFRNQLAEGSKPIERSYARSGLLAHVVTGKYANHLSLYRQSEIYRRQGVELSRVTQGHWTGAVSELLEALYDALRQYVLMQLLYDWIQTQMKILLRHSNTAGRLHTC